MSVDRGPSPVMVSIHILWATLTVGLALCFAVGDLYRAAEHAAFLLQARPSPFLNNREHIAYVIANLIALGQALIIIAAALCALAPRAGLRFAAAVLYLLLVITALPMFTAERALKNWAGVTSWWGEANVLHHGVVLMGLGVGTVGYALAIVARNMALQKRIINGETGC